MRPSKLKLCAIIVTFNRLDQLKTTLAAVLYENVDHVVVVDNSSTDSTASWLHTQVDNRLHIVSLPTNTGGAGGFEAGMAYAAARIDPDWVVLMDDDARPQPGALATFRTEIPKLESNFPNLGIVAASVFYPNGTLCEMNRPSRNPFWNLGLFVKTLLKGTRSGFHLTDTDFSADAPAIPIDVASFVGYFVHRRAWETSGLPEGGLFIYGDDVLYSLRLRRAGFAMAFAPMIRFTHDCGTMGDRFIYRPVWKIYYHCRNGVSIARQAAGPLMFPFALLYYTVIWWQRGNAYPAELRHTYYWMMRMGLWDGLRHRRGRQDAVHENRNS